MKKESRLPASWVVSAVRAGRPAAANLRALRLPVSLACRSELHLESCRSSGAEVFLAASLSQYVVA